MLFLITGASGSGKSEYAESLVCRLAQKENRKKLYVATMESGSQSAEKRILRHRRLRAGKGFETVEAPLGFLEREHGQGEDLCMETEEKPVVLLECMSNLLANLLFSAGLSGWEAETEILRQTELAVAACCHLVIVTNEIFSDGIGYEKETMNYIQTLGRINCHLAAKADVFCEVVYTIPVCRKGEKEWLL